MPQPGPLETKSVVPTLVRALLCLVGIAWLVALQCPTTDDRSPTAPDGCAFFSAAAVEISSADDFGATLEDSVELLRIDLHELPALIDQTASASKASAWNTTSSRPDLSPPLLV